MDITDIVILSIIVFFAIRGLFAGLIIGVVGMLGIALALIFSYMVYTPIHNIVVNMGVTDDKISSVITYVLGFLLIYVIVFLMGKILHRFITMIHLGGLNRLGGLIFGGVKGAVIASIFLWIVMLFIPKESAINNSIAESKLVPYILPIPSIIYKKLNEISGIDRFLPFDSSDIGL